MKLFNTAANLLLVASLLILPSSIVSSSIDEEQQGSYTSNKRAHRQTSIEIVNAVIAECDNAALCVLKRFADYVTDTREELAFATLIRERLSSRLETYTCSDTSLKESNSKPIRVVSWRNKWQVNILHERPSSKIHLIPNFIHPPECQAILNVVEGNVTNQSNSSSRNNNLMMSPGTIAANGTSNPKVRKVLQTNIDIPWKEEHQGNPIATVARRVYDYANHVFDGLEIREEGQASFKYLHYAGRGRNDTEPDHYSSHCDGACDGSQHVRGGRVATMVMYCETAKDGGHTNFRNAAVHIAAKPGDALFFTYVDPKTLKMDNGFSMHSGCPVYKGNKKVVTQWIRLGVDELHPYNSFDLL